MSYEPDPVVQVQPAVSRPVVQVSTQPVVRETVVGSPLARGTIATTSTRRFAFDSFVVGLVGLALTIIGLIAVTRAGFDGTMEEPVVEVLGFTHTTTLGLIEAFLGIALLICAATTSRSGALFFGLVLGVAGIVGAVQTESFERSLGLESSLAWLAVVAAAVILLVSLLVPRMTARTARIEPY